MTKNKIKRTAEFLVNVSSNSAKDLEGYLEFIPSGESARFESLMEMLNLMQAKLDDYGAPQPTTMVRSWNEDVDRMRGGG